MLWWLHFFDTSDLYYINLTEISFFCLRGKQIKLCIISEKHLNLHVVSHNAANIRPSGRVNLEMLSLALKSWSCSLTSLIGLVQPKPSHFRFSWKFKTSSYLTHQHNSSYCSQSQGCLYTGWVCFQFVTWFAKCAYLWSS